jgi:SAM-dependent methyltransferase
MTLKGANQSHQSLEAARLFEKHFESLRLKPNPHDFDESYYRAHRLRFFKTLDLIPPSKGAGTALEVGATDFFQVALGRVFGYVDVTGTYFTPNIEEKFIRRSFKVADLEASNMSVSLNLENELLPFGNEALEFILCGEVIEHMDVDPMFMLSEFNRVLPVGGRVLLTTPNCCSARNFWKIAHGYRPHFFMQYEKSRSPYRHNIEYDVHAVVSLLEAAGFHPLIVETYNVFEEPVPEAEELLRKVSLPTDHRGDCIFALAEKASLVKERWPYGIYI